MKRIIISLVATATISLSAFGQAPEGFKYQAVVRDAGNTILNNQAVGMRMTIQQGSIGGTTVYQETFSPTTNAYGLVNLEIGSGTVVSGNFTTIDWSAGPYFIETAVDVTGGTSYAVMGTSQLMSVPYALLAKKAENVMNDLVDDADADPTNELQDWSNLPGIPANIDIDATDDFSGDFNDLTNKPTTVDSISMSGDTLYLSNGDVFVGCNNASAFILPTIITNTVTAISSNSATFGGAISYANGNQIMERGIVYSTSPNPTLGSNKIVIGNGIGTFDTITGISYQYPHLLQSNTTYYVRAYAITENNISAYGNEVSFTTLTVGQAGPGGGIVFFDKGNSTDGWQYLESATSDQNTNIEWGCYLTPIMGTQPTVGSGEANTSLIVSGCNEASFAAKLCYDLNLGGQTDWFLPSRDELNLMYKNLHMQGLGGFNLNYWSSTQTPFLPGSESYVFAFFGEAYSMSKYLTFNVRAIRAF